MVDGRSIGRFSFVILYADDIIILSTALTELQRLLCACEKELTWLDMSINIKKSCCNERQRVQSDFLFCSIND